MVTVLKKAQSALGIPSGENLIVHWTGPHTPGAIRPEMGRRAFPTEAKL